MSLSVWVVEFSFGYLSKLSVWRLEMKDPCENSAFRNVEANDRAQVDNLVELGIATTRLKQIIDSAVFAGSLPLCFFIRACRFRIFTGMVS